MSSPPAILGGATKQKALKVKQQKRSKADDPLLACLVWSVASGRHLAQPLPSLLLPDHFKAFVKLKLSGHNQTLETRHGLALPSVVKLKEYVPQLFGVLRERVFGLTHDEYAASLTNDLPIRVGTARDDASGGSGDEESAPPEQCEYVSADGQLHVRQISSDAVSAVHTLLKQYHPQVVQRKARTLLPQYLGLYRISMGESRNSYLLVSRNLVSADRSLVPIHWQKTLTGGTQPIAGDQRLQLGADERERLLETLTVDVEWLASHNLIDYGLRVACHRLALCPEDPEPEDGSPPASPIPSRRQSYAVLDERPRHFYAVPSRAFAARQDGDTAERSELYFIGLTDVLTSTLMSRWSKTPKPTPGDSAEDKSKALAYAHRLLDCFKRSLDDTT